MRCDEESAQKQKQHDLAFSRNSYSWKRHSRASRLDEHRTHNSKKSRVLPGTARVKHSRGPSGGEAGHTIAMAEKQITFQKRCAGLDCLQCFQITISAVPVSFVSRFLPAAIVCLATSSSFAALTISLHDKTVTTTGVAEGHTIAFLSVALRPMETHSRLEAHDVVLADDDRDGVLTWTLRDDLPLRSMVTAVDLTTGDYVVSFSEGYTMPVRPLPTPADVRSTYLEAPAQMAEALYVTPGSGAWRITVGDGGETDADGARNGKVRLESAQFRAIAGDGKPRLKTGDTVIIVDERKMELYAGRVAR
jgi:hypothetical protein